MHGAVEIIVDMPAFKLRLERKYDEDSKLVYDLAYQVQFQCAFIIEKWCFFANETTIAMVYSI